MSTETPAPVPAPGFFGLLAKRQLAQYRPATGSLRPWLPYSFDSPSSVPEFEPPRAPFRPDATDVPAQSSAPRRLERDDVEYQAVQSPLPTTKTGAFTESNETGLRPPVNHDFTTAVIKATPTRPVDHVEQAQQVPAARRDAPSTLMGRSVPPRASGTNLQTESQLHTQERVVTVERPGQPERPVSPLPLPLQPQNAQARDITLTPRVTPRVPLPATPFRRQRETEPEPTIEIHIGRLEVRAQTAPAVRPAPDETDSADQRLSAYLRRRGNGARS